jgi:GR25 family glycosyltransferase involved in LPS biosynthesis
MKLSDLNIIFINLNRNKDRLKHITNEFEKMNLTNVTRIEAIDEILKQCALFQKEYMVE